MNLTYRAGAALLLMAGLIAGACGDDDDEGTSTLPPPGPPELRVTSIRAAPGVTWSPGDPLPIKLDCERSIVVNVGPLTGGQLTNWTLRPPLVCAGLLNCGYIVLSLLDDSGARLYGTEAAQTSLAVDLSMGVPEDVSLLRAELFDATTQRPFVQTDGGAAFDEIEVTFELPTGCETGAGGAAGAGGAGGEGGAPGAAGQAGAGGSGAPEGGAGGTPSAGGGQGGA
jgi:hypothetical protein